MAQPDKLKHQTQAFKYGKIGGWPALLLFYITVHLKKIYY